MALDSDILRMQQQVAKVIGDEKFNDLVRSIFATKMKARLRYWQEQLLEEVATRSNIRITEYHKFLHVFETATPRELPQGPWNREVFLRAIEDFPLGGFPLEETPARWMAEAWLSDVVRDTISSEFARSVSKTGGLWYADDYLGYLGRALTVEQMVALFVFIRDESGCGSRESEFRPEFERAFPQCIVALPPPLPYDPELDDLMKRQCQGVVPPITDEIPF